MGTFAIQLVFVFSVLFALPVLGQTSSFIANLFATQQSGTGTYYGTTTGGNCGYTTLIPTFVNSLTQIAIQSADYAGNNLSEGCGMCIKMAGTGTGSGADPITTTPFIAFVQDQCPSCATNGVDIALPGDGAWGITWIAVPCPVGSTKIAYQLQGSNPYYIKLQVIGHSIPVTGVTFVIGGTNYPATRTQDNFWLSPGNAPTPFIFPITLLLTAFNGETLTDIIQSADSWASAVLLSGSGVQFSTSTPTAPTKPPTAPPTAPPTTPTKPPTTPTKPPTAPPTTPTKPPTAPPTTPTKPPATPPTTPTNPPTNIVCGSTGCTNNDYWVEFQPPTSYSGTPPATAAVLCGSTQYSCNWYAAGSKYQCSPTASCPSPVPYFNNQPCPFTTAQADDSGQVATSAGQTLSAGAIAGIVIVAILIIVGLIVFVVIRKRSQNMGEYV